MTSRLAPEILAPVGNWDMCRAAVHNGADAIYLGLPGFNARGRAELLDLDTLKEMIEFCHLYGTKVFVASNILLFEREIEQIRSLLYDIIPLKPDAFIVQDIGLVRLIHEICPEQVIHASTQMTVTSYEAIEMTADLGMQRYVLGRECSIAEVEKIRAKTDKELEVFVHGALCVSYSGQCLTSESFGGRSANRGQCAQSCRLDYELLVDGVAKEMGEKRYLVSPQDLCSIDDVPKLIGAGVDSFKIEGRLKSPGYVADTVRHYKAAVIHADALSDIGSVKQELALTYSRGFFNGWMDGVNHQRLVDGRFSNHHGLEIGEILSVGRSELTLSTSNSLQPGDGLLFADFKANKECGASVYEVFSSGEDQVRVRFSKEFDLASLKPGMRVFMNASPSLTKSLERSWTVREDMRRIPVSLTATGAVGSKLLVTVRDTEGRSVAVESDAALQAAERAPLSAQMIKDELGALGSTPFVLDNFSFSADKAVFLNNKELKNIRRRFVELLTEQRKKRAPRTVVPEAIVAQWQERVVAPYVAHTANNPRLNALIREKGQLQGLSGLSLDTVYLDFEYGKEYEAAVQEVRDLGFKAGIATTRILKPGELGHLKVIERLKPDTVLVRNLGALKHFTERGIHVAGDFSLNVTNSLSASWFLSKGVASLCPSYDLNGEQLLDLVSQINAGAFEITIHQYMPAFHMEHCVFAAFLSTGTSFRDCGKPCEEHRVELRDHTGALHPLKPDAECRNTMFNGTAQSGARLIPQLKERGVSAFRVEALFETPEELRTKLKAYESLILQDEAYDSVLPRLGAIERFGVTEGQLFNIKTHKDRRKGASAPF